MSFINIRDTKYDLASSGVIVCAYQDIDLNSKTEISAFFVNWIPFINARDGRASVERLYVST